MTAVAVVIAATAISLIVGAAVGWFLPPHGRLPAREKSKPVKRILLPFTGQAIPRRALEAAVRLAKAEDATLMPAFLTEVPLNLPIDSALPSRCLQGMPLLEAIEQSATVQGARVDSRISRGRSYRDALRRLLEKEEVDRIVIPATGDPVNGLSAEDLEWLLERVPAEVLILRAAPDDERSLSAAAVAGHF
jgi:nucleotide-binding universal stress UspA family protein